MKNLYFIISIFLSYSSIAVAACPVFLDMEMEMERFITSLRNAQYKPDGRLLFTYDNERFYISRESWNELLKPPPGFTPTTIPRSSMISRLRIVHENFAGDHCEYKAIFTDEKEVKFTITTILAPNLGVFSLKHAQIKGEYSVYQTPFGDLKKVTHTFSRKNSEQVLKVYCQQYTDCEKVGGITNEFTKIVRF